MSKNHGGARKGAGRKPVAVEKSVREAIAEALGDKSLSKVWQAVIKQAEQGSERHIQILFNYYYGKPKENEGQPSEMVIRVVRRS